MSALDELTNPRNWDYLNKWIGSTDPDLTEAADELAAKDAVIDAAREVARGMTDPDSWDDGDDFVLSAWQIKALVAALEQAADSGKG